MVAKKHTVDLRSAKFSAETKPLLNKALPAVKQQHSPAGCIIAEAGFNRLQVLHDQIAGTAELLFGRLQNEIEKDNPAMTAFNVIREKAAEANRIIEAGFGALDAKRLGEVVKN